MAAVPASAAPTLCNLFEHFKNIRHTYMHIYLEYKIYKGQTNLTTDLIT